MKKTFILVAALLCGFGAQAERNISIVPTDTLQPDFVAAYAYALRMANEGYKTEDALHDVTLFGSFGQFSVYAGLSGDVRGKLILPMRTTANLGQDTVDIYDWTKNEHAALRYKTTSASVLVFCTKEQFENYTASSGADYFTNLFKDYFSGSDMYRTVNEDELPAALTHADARLLIIPDFARENNDETYFANMVAAKYPGMAAQLRLFLQRGGVIYAEGNGGYLLQKLGLLADNTLDYAQVTHIENVAPVTSSSNHFVATTLAATDNKMYLYNIPAVDPDKTGEVIASYNGIPVLFERTEESGRMIVNLGMPTFSGLQGLRNTETEKQKNASQSQWFLNTLLYAHFAPVDATHKVRNEIKADVTAPPNAVPFDEADEFEVQVTVRNLSAVAVNNISITETVIAGLTPVTHGGVCGDFSASGQTLTTQFDLPAFGETVLRYTLRMPKPNTTPHDNLNNIITSDGRLSVLDAGSAVTYTAAGRLFRYSQPRAIAYVLLSADLYCDVDVNWKNALGTYYQPFKVFMNVENKGRTAAKEVVYEQYIPIDVPVYWVDGAINIPVLKTAGGKYVDILRGVKNISDKNLSAADLQGHDLDLDGKPDAWLDQSTIYPKGYQLKDTMIYWRNPWDHFRGKPWLPVAEQQPCAPDSVYWFEDINHNGIYTCYTAEKGFFGYDAKQHVETAEDAGDKLRTWKVTWNIGTIPGLQTFEPFMSYELWLDVPNLSGMAAGVAKAYGEMQKLDRQGSAAIDNTGYYYFPYHSFGSNIPDNDIGKVRNECPECDERWKYWMNADASGNPVWRRLVHTQRYDYMGYKWVVDGVAINSEIYNGTGKPYEDLYGVTPVPNDAFNLVPSLGGEDIDMTKFFSDRTEPTHITYNTIFGEKKDLGMRTCYTFYSPLPNPLQFEYLSNSYEITDPASGAVLKNLPYKGKANLTFYMSAGTEYSYYWIREAGTKAGISAGGSDSPSYTPNTNTWRYDHSNYIDGIPEAGDGVVGYLVYEVPKGMGGYRINLPRKNPGDPSSAFDTDKIVQIKTPRAKTMTTPANTEEGRARFKQMRDEMQYEVWEPIHHNDNTPDSIQIFDDGIKYSIWIPQILIPPSLDDNDEDGIDDWIDDEGDRFYNSSNQAYLRSFVPHGTGYDIEARGALNSADTVGCHHDDDDMGYSLRGWCPGGDGQFGDDRFEELGKVYFKINVEYEGKGKEGPVSVSRGGTLVCEEIFGGSPWVIYAHVLSGWAEGVEMEMKSQAEPSTVRFGNDTVLLRNTITDLSEIAQWTEQNANGSYVEVRNTGDPLHRFDNNFDPYHLTAGYDHGEVTVTTYVGGKDPCSLIEPAENINLSAVINPNVKKTVTLIPSETGTITGYPKTLHEKSLVQVKIEFTNNSSLDWRNVRLQTLIPDSLQNKLKVEMEYLAYPRPLVPGDNIGDLQAGWRFNEPEGEVLVYLGNELPLIQPPRRAYYLVLLSVSDELADGVYEINFDMQGNRCSPVTQAPISTFAYMAPRALLSIQRGSVANPLTLGQCTLDSLLITPENDKVYRPFGAVKVSQTPVTSLAAYEALSDTLPVTRRTASVIDLSSLGLFPTTAIRQLHAVEKAAITCTNAAVTSERITASQRLFYTLDDGRKVTLSSPAVSVNTRGPKIIITKEITALNGQPYRQGDALGAGADGYAELTMTFTAENRGSGAENVRALYTNEGLFIPVADKIRQTCPLCTINGSSVNLYFGTMMSGSKVTDTLYYTISAADVTGSGDESASRFSVASVAQSPAASSSADWLAVLTDGDIRFESSGDRRTYQYNDTNATRVLFYELQPADVTLMEDKIIIGKSAEFVATVKNYAYPVTQVEVSLYAFNEVDTVFLCSGVIAQISTAGVATVALQHKFTDARLVRDEKIRLLLKVNPHAEIPELDYNNDSQFFDAEVGVPNMEDDGKLVIFPNPAVTDVNFVYDDCLLSVRKMEMCLYRSRSGKLACHSGTQCQVNWNLSSFPPGIYVVRIEVTLQDGSRKQYLRRLALER